MDIFFGINKLPKQRRVGHDREPLAPKRVVPRVIPKVALRPKHRPKTRPLTRPSTPEQTIEQITIPTRYMGPKLKKE